MIKVKLTKYKLIASGYYNGESFFLFDKSRDEMKQWCRDTFGKGYNKNIKSWLWKSSTIWEDDVLYPVFYFTSETHASWFLLRWG